jgi:hypothetical protein
MPSVASWAGCQSGTCGACSAACPAPAATDQCDGSVGQWSGCRGSGCYVCVELVSSYPKYFEHHPNCAKNTTCQNSYFTCSAACPAPTDTDK